MVHGIHHITAIASNPQTCYDFYAGVLGLRLIKKSVNQDQVEAYHLFFGDKLGNPGMDLTFFTFLGINKGIPGTGEVSRISLAIPADSLSFWQNRLHAHHIKTEKINRFDTDRLSFIDPDGLILELVAVPAAEFATAGIDPHHAAGIPRKHAIGYFYSATLNAHRPEAVDLIVEYLGYHCLDKHGDLSLYTLGSGFRATLLETKIVADSHATQGFGSVHHIAFAVTNEAALIKARESIYSIALNPTGIIDRYYFKSVYFRTPSGILFELATHGPGFTVDEPAETLGQKLALPPFLESQRSYIESILTPINQS